MPRVKQGELTDTQRNDIRKYASLQFSITEVALMVGMDPDEFSDNEEADAIFWRARLTEQAAQRLAIIKEARNGDAQSQKLVLEWAKVSNQ